jgi:hypothetical protein
MEGNYGVFILMPVLHKQTITIPSNLNYNSTSLKIIPQQLTTFGIIWNCLQILWDGAQVRCGKE